MEPINNIQLKTKHTYKGLPIVLCALLFLLSPTLSLAQKITATASIDSNSISIGQQVNLKLRIEYNVDEGKQVNITWPQINDTLIKEIEVISQTAIDTIIPDSSNVYRFAQLKTLLITSFDSGYWAMPPLKFIVNGDSNGVFTNPLLLEVNSISVDTALAIKDIKAPFEVNYSWVDWVKDNPYKVFGTLAALMLILLTIYLVKKYYKPKPEVQEKPAPKIPAHIIAFKKLDKLKEEKLWQDGMLKLYHITLSEIVREYIENRFSIQALEQTTEEIIYGFRNIAIDEESKAKLKQVLILSDLVKFAKEQSLPNENELSLSNVYDFINGTLREEEKPLTEQATSQNNENSKYMNRG